MDIQEISDRLEIADVIVRYADAIDSRCFELLDDLFTPDAVIDYTAFGAPRGDLTSTKVFLAKVLGAHERYCHLLGQSMITIDGDVASARTACHNPMVLRKPDGSEHLYVCGLWYADRFVRTESSWRIAERVEERCYLQGL